MDKIIFFLNIIILLYITNLLFNKYYNVLDINNKNNNNNNNNNIDKTNIIDQTDNTNISINNNNKNGLVKVNLIPDKLPYDTPIHISLNDPEIEPKIKHLLYSYIYVLPENIFLKLKNKNLKIYFKFIKKKILFIGFYVSSPITINMKKNDALELKTYIFKLYDSYVLGDTRIFNNIEDIILSQGIERDMYGDKTISTVYLNEICANKLEYVKYFVKNNVMINTFIDLYNIGENKSGYYVKAPYSSRSVCAQYEKLGDLCHIDDGVIIQKENKTLSMYEFKCYCIDGELKTIILRRDNGDYNICIPKNGEGIDTAVYGLVRKKLKEIEKLCKKTFYLVNNLVNMRVEKLKVDTNYSYYIINDIEKDNKLDRDFKDKIRYILTSLVNSKKINLINELNNKYNKSYSYDIVTKNLSDYPEPKNPKIYDRFMRIDMALPDNHNYNKMTITEIEPFASGIFLNRTIKKCMYNNLHNKFKSIVQYNLYSIISSEHN